MGQSLPHYESISICITMKKSLLIPLLVLGISAVFAQKPTYGHNKAAGKFLKIRDFTMYVETYGQGKPLLLIHGNGSDISAMHNQIEYFKKSRRVIVADSRGHGQSTADPNTVFSYDLLAGDWAALMDTLKLNKVDIFGWSDGGIIGILLAKDYPKRLDKVYSFGTNLKHGKEAFEEYLDRNWTKFYESMPSNTDAEKIQKAIAAMILSYPNVNLEELKKVQVPIMVATADQDMIKLEHSVQIYKSLPNAHFQVFSNANHFIPWEDAPRINASIDNFINKPFVKIAPAPKEYLFLFEK